MQKTKLGISVGLLGAALYFAALMNIIALVVVAGYVLLFEENEWLKKTAVKAAAIVLFFGALLACVNLIGNSSSLLNDVAFLFNGSINLARFNRVLAICRSAIAIAQALLLVLLGFKALKQGSVKFGIIDNAINKHM